MQQFISKAVLARVPLYAPHTDATETYGCGVAGVLPCSTDVDLCVLACWSVCGVSAATQPCLVEWHLVQLGHADTNQPLHAYISYSFVSVI